MGRIACQFTRDGTTVARAPSPGSAYPRRTRSRSPLCLEVGRTAVLSALVVRVHLRQVLLLIGAALVCTALGACGVQERSKASAQTGAGGEAAAAASKDEAGQLLNGGPEAFKARLAQLRGRPVVVNQWASWCGPCKFEFPFFARQAVKYDGRVSFLGVNSQDNRRNAAAFLKTTPVPFPHYFDPKGEVARVFRGGRAFPTTAFYDAAGELAFTHLGAYPNEAKLEEDIRRYALDG